MAENGINGDFRELLSVVADHRTLSKMAPLERSEIIRNTAQRIESCKTPLEIPDLDKLFESIDGLIWYFPEVLTHLVLNGMQPEQVAKLATCCRPATRDAFEQRLPLIKSPNAANVQAEIDRKRSFSTKQAEQFGAQAAIGSESTEAKVLAPV